jgi:hypothetical protein
MSNSPFQLLTRDPARRLGSGKEDAEEIKRQPFFKDINFDDVLNKRIPPPYFPTIVCPLHGNRCLLMLTILRRTEAPIPAISTRNSRASSLPSLPCMANYLPATNLNSTAFLG